MRQDLPQHGISTRYADRPHVLVLDDDDRIRKLLLRYLFDQGFLPVSASDAEEAFQVLELFLFDIAIVDVMMPGMDGLTFTRKLRESSHLPVLLLTALGEGEDRITGLESGADDYLVKPFEPRELVLRIQSILRRQPPVSDIKTDSPVQIGPWQFRPGDLFLSDGDDMLRLTPVHERLLTVLARHPNETVSREILAEAACPTGGERAVDTHISRLRDRLGDDAGTGRYIQSVRGKGYMLRVEKP